MSTYTKDYTVEASIRGQIAPVYVDTLKHSALALDRASKMLAEGALSVTITANQASIMDANPLNPGDAHGRQAVTDRAGTLGNTEGPLGVRPAKQLGLNVVASDPAEELGPTDQDANPFGLAPAMAEGFAAAREAVMAQARTIARLRVARGNLMFIVGYAEGTLDAIASDVGFTPDNNARDWRVSRARVARDYVRQHMDTWRGKFGDE